MQETIKINPSWTSLVLLLARLYVDGENAESRKIAEEELLRLARIADSFIEEAKKELE